jgi:hypothetical protein
MECECEFFSSRPPHALRRQEPIDDGDIHGAILFFAKSPLFAAATRGRHRRPIHGTRAESCHKALNKNGYFLRFPIFPSAVTRQNRVLRGGNRWHFSNTGSIAAGSDETVLHLHVRIPVDRDLPIELTAATVRAQRHRRDVAGAMRHGSCNCRARESWLNSRPSASTATIARVPFCLPCRAQPIPQFIVAGRANDRLRAIGRGFSAASSDVVTWYRSRRSRTGMGARAPTGVIGHSKILGPRR